MRVHIAVMRTPDGHSRLELPRFLAPTVTSGHRAAPVNALSCLRVMFAVDALDETPVRLGKRGATLIGDVVRYENMYRFCYIHRPGGILIGVAQRTGSRPRARGSHGREPMRTEKVVPVPPRTRARGRGSG